MSAHGLEVRIPFLDLEFVETYLSVKDSLRIPQKGIEKWLLRKSFEGVIPDDVLRRKKEAFSDGVSTVEDSWFGMIQKLAETKVSDEQFASRAVRFPEHTPQTKEQYWYRDVFERRFGVDRVGTIPYFRMPKWVKESVDPSARVLEVYE